MIKLNQKILAIGVAAVLLIGTGIGSYWASSRQINDLKEQLATKATRADLATDEELRTDYYNTETATLVSPHTLRLAMDKGEVDFVLIDTRAAKDYELGHIRGAISIPFDGSEETIEKYRQAIENGKNERRSYAIVYCYNTACMLGRKTGKALAAAGIYVKELGIGYANWEKQHDIWNNPGEVYNINDYIVRGTQPGELKPSADFLNRPCSENAAYSC